MVYDTLTNICFKSLQLKNDGKKYFRKGTTLEQMLGVELLVCLTNSKWGVVKGHMVVFGGKYLKLFLIIKSDKSYQVW